LDVLVEILFRTEFSNSVVLAVNIVEKMTKITMFDDDEASAPLYEENSTIVESITTTVVKIKMKMNEVFLLRVKVV
jgi:hypothetical protein